MPPSGTPHLDFNDMKKPYAHLHEVQFRRGDDIIANPRDDTPRWQRIVIDICLLFGILLMLFWPWTFFGIVNANDGIQMSLSLSDIVRRYPQRVGAVVTFIGTTNQFIMTFLLSQIIVRFGQELISLANVTVFDVSALSAFRYMTVVWGIGQWKGLAKGNRRLAILGLFLAALGASSLAPSGTAILITPGQFNKTAELRGREIDFTSDDPGCLEWLGRNGAQNRCDWMFWSGTSYTMCLGENQMMDVLDSGRANVLAALRINNETSSLNQLGGKGAIRFRGSAKGILPIGPNGVPAFNALKNSSNPFLDDALRRRIMTESYNYTLNHQGFESDINCFYDDTSPIRYRNISNINTTMVISSLGTCDPAAGLQDVLQDVEEYPTLNRNNTMTYWACKQTPQSGSLEPTYFVYLRGRMYYEKSIGNITCRISPMRAQEYSVTYLSVPGYFTTSRALVEQSPRKPTFSRYIEGGLVGLGNVFWEGQNWSANLVAEAVFSLGAKKSNFSTSERNPIYPKMYEAMIQGMLEYEATYSRLIYSAGRAPSTCFRDVVGEVTAYRLTFVAVTIGLGTAKAIKASDSAVSVTIEWVSGVVILLLAFFLSQYEIKDTAKPYWFFKADMMDGVRTLFRPFGIKIPQYETEERTLDLLIKPKHPPVTGYRIIVTAAAILFGMTKAMLSYRGEQTGPMTVEWAYGIVVTVILYWLGLYETSSSEVMPWLFTTNYWSQVATGSVAIGYIVIHLIGLAGIGLWTSMWGYGVVAVIKSGWGPSPTTPDSPPTTSFDLFFQHVFMLMWLVVAIGMGIGGGVFVGCRILVSLAGVVKPLLLKGIRSVWQPLRHLLARVLPIDLDAGVDDDDATLTLENPSPGLQWCFTILMTIGIAILYVLAHGVAFIIAFGWTSLWFYGLKTLWSQKMGSWFMLSFTLFWSAGASIAVVIGLAGTLAVVASFFILALRYAFH
ncbi:hypothetical protein EST38_g10038 [Candolleomyces aberdarensis]|uniref:Uncharacterized protein n=1 Tax=Candolleomyces aberdarensis TaxID=2316362 RepID=A0A4Q2DBP4_9AGAR|nr:hypothetical protein EST38_g10038 [Candolleomyces aberdarensis]